MPAALSLCAGLQNWPQRPIRIVVGLPGGGVGTLARRLGPKRTGAIGQPVVVDNQAQ